MNTGTASQDDTSVHSGDCDSNGGQVIWTQDCLCDLFGEGDFFSLRGSTILYLLHISFVGCEKCWRDLILSQQWVFWQYPSCVLNLVSK